jgi:plastocyanin
MIRSAISSIAVLGVALALSVTAPSAATAQPAAPGAMAKAAVQTLNWTAGDDITRYRSAPTQAVAGETTVVLENSAATGNTTGMPHTLTFDTSTEGYNHDVNVNLFASPFDTNNGRQQQTVTLTPGRYRYFCSIPGHSEMVGVLVVTDGGGADTTPPTVSGQVTGSQNANGDYVAGATVAVTAADAQSGVAGVEYQVDDTSFQPYTAPVRVTAIGDHSVQFRATDKAGNTSAVGSVSFRVVQAPDPADTTAPTVASSVAGDTDASGNYLGSATVTLTASDTQSGVATVEYAVDDAAFGPYTAPIVLNRPGMHMVHYRATDKAGNVSAEGLAHVTVVARPVEDTTAPTVSSSVAGERDESGRYLDAATVTVTATDTQSGVKTVEYSVDGQAFVTYTAAVVVSSVGAHTVRYRAGDVAGNTSAEGTTTFTVVRRPDPDTTAPVTSAAVTGNRDTDGNYLGSATVTLTATDAQSAITSIELAVEDGDWITYTGPVTIRTAGPHTVRYRAADAARNVSEQKSVSFTIVASEGDACPDSDPRATVVIATEDTGVSSIDTGNGCNLNDLIAERAPYPSHGSFVRHVEGITRSLVASGTLTRRQQGAIVRAAARSDIGT